MPGAAGGPGQDAGGQHNPLRRKGLPGASMASKAAVSRPSPASTAVASPYTLWLVGRPLRRSSSSMQGRSSWIRE